MQSGPIPPHERSWRHPSEVAAEQRAVLASEGSPRSTKVLALTTGTVGLLAIGALMVTITPRGIESPVALASTTSLSAQAAVVPPAQSADSAGSAPVGLRSQADEEVASMAPIVNGNIDVLATPIGDGRFAVVTRESLRHARHSVIDVRLVSGRHSTGSIVTGSDDAVVVALIEAEPGHEVAHDMPEGRDIVTVLASPPVTVRLDEISLLDVAEGTAVLDDEGALIGLCSQHRDGTVVLIEVSGALDAATSVVP